MDFRGLTDDQLVALVRSLCYEAAQRGWAVHQAAQNAMLDEAEKVRIAAEAAAQEAERLRQAEAERIAKEAAERVRWEAEAQKSQAEKELEKRKEQRIAAFCEAVYTVTGEHCAISVWHPKDMPVKDRRVYFDQGDGFDRRGWKICVYVTGSHNTRPGTVTGADGAYADALCKLAKLVSQDWIRVKFTTEVYVNRDDLDRGSKYAARYEPILAAYRTARAEEKAAAEAKRQAAQAEAEHKTAEKARKDAAYAEKVSAELASFREFLAQSGSTAHLVASKLGERHLTITMIPQQIHVHYNRYAFKIEKSDPDQKALAEKAITVLNELRSTLNDILAEQPPLITLTPLEVTNA
jgi:hypothetical protein